MSKRSVDILILSAVALFLAAGVHITQEFRFYNIESNDLFLYDWNHIRTELLKTGGLATLLGSFLTQFMRIHFIGTVIVTVLYLLSAHLLYKSLSKLSGGPVMAGLSFLPVVFLFLCMENDYYRFQGHIAFILMLTALYAYASIPEDRLRYIAGALTVPVLYHAAGSIALVFAVTAVIWDLAANGIKGFRSLICPVVFAITAVVYVKASMVSSWEHSLTPFMYYDWPSTYFFPVYAWAMVPLLFLLAWVLSKLKIKLFESKISAIAVIILLFFIAGNFYSQVHSRSYYRLIQEQYWAENEDWDTIIKTADRRQPTFLVSYLNLALAKKGLLVDNFKYYNPQDLSSLMYPTPNLKTGLSLQSNVYMAWGYLGSARKAAFDGNVVTPGSRHPRQIQALIKLNLVLGAHDVAEKYIMLLEKTMFYRKWASSMRRFLGDVDAIRGDEEMGMMYASLPLTDEYARYEGVIGDMRDIHQACPSNFILSQFYELYQILEEAR